MIKDMSDADLLAYIHDLRVLLNNASNLGASNHKPTRVKAARNFGWMLKQLDIAVAVKRSRGI